MTPAPPASGDDAGDRVVLDTDSVKHQQVRRHLLDMIATMPVGEQLPPERVLAARFGVSRVTFRQAVSSLVESGHVVRRQGAGTFVADPRISKRAEFLGFSEEMAARGMVPSSRVISATTRAAGNSVGAELGLSPAEQVVHIERVRMGNGIPICLEEVDLPARRVPGIEDLDLTGSLYAVLSDTYGIVLSEAEQVIRTIVLDEQQAEALGVPPFSAALVIERLGFDAQRRPIERAVSVYRGDRYDIRQTVKRFVH